MDQAAREKLRHLGERYPAQEKNGLLTPKESVSLPKRRLEAGMEEAARGCGPKAGLVSAFPASAGLRDSLSPVGSEVPAPHRTSHTGTRGWVLSCLSTPNVGLVGLGV